MKYVYWNICIEHWFINHGAAIIHQEPANSTRYVSTVWSVNGWIIRKPLETSGNRPWQFPTGFRQVTRFFYYEKKYGKNNYTNKKFGNLCGRFPEVSSRFPDNPSLTDHSPHGRYLYVILTTEVWF